MLYTSKQLGFGKYPVEQISIEGCGASPDDPHYMPDNNKWAAHAHVCKKDPAKGMICFAEPYYINRVLFLHEYAHLIDKNIDFPCPHNREEFVSNWDAIQKTGHGKSWVKILEDLGEYVPMRYKENIG